MPAQKMTINFAKAEEIRQHPSGNLREEGPIKPLSSEGKVLTPKQIRARARRRQARNALSEEERLALYRKPVEEWDLTELAHGRPRNSRGGFSGPKPKWITAEIHERAMERYTAAVKSNMKVTTVDALGLLQSLINNEDLDEKGRPIVPASTKLDAAKFLIEHVVGKPTQRIENDVSVKLQGILGQVMVNPSDMGGGGYAPAHYPGITMELAERDEDEMVYDG